ncbi:MAG: hypothetical protein JWO62_1375 [Acidimicrobiaceae bacterium]|nr:hypothetical protein [Acidimicrobiaceae bacterium]
MTALDEARDRLASGTPTWESLRAEGRAWEDRLVSHTARVRSALRPLAVKVSARAEEALGEREQTWRLWRGGLVLLRSEYTSGNETVTVVAQGPRWWRTSPSLGSTGGGESRSVALLIGPAVVLVEGSRLVADLDLVEAAPAHFLGRDAYVVRARPGSERPGAQALIAELGRGADEYQVVVDAERAVVLSLVALAAGRPFRRVETTLVAFDEPMPPQLFTPDRAAADHVSSPGPVSRRLSLEDLATSVGFTVLVPDPPPSSAAPHVAIVAPSRRGTGAPRATVTYPLPRTDGLRGNLRIQLSSGELPTRSSEHWRSVGDCEVCDQPVGGSSRPRVRAKRSGTYVELESSVLSADDLVRIARSLVPLRAG